MVETNKISDSDLLTMCNEIHSWKNTGELQQDGVLKRLYNEHRKEFYYISYFEEHILREAHSRFGNVVKLLMCNNPSLYMR